MLGFYVNSIYYTSRKLHILRRDPTELGVVDTSDAVVGIDGNSR